MADGGYRLFVAHRKNIGAVKLAGLFLPFERALADIILAQGVQDVLDIGCGAGATSLTIAELLRTSGTCTGIDISGALVKVARDRAIATGLGNARFLRADAQRHDRSRSL